MELDDNVHQQVVCDRVHNPCRVALPDAALDSLHEVVSFVAIVNACDLVVSYCFQLYYDKMDFCN